MAVKRKLGRIFLRCGALGGLFVSVAGVKWGHKYNCIDTTQLSLHAQTNQVNCEL